MPSARIFWPTITLDESPKRTGTSFSAGTRMLSTATSLAASAPMTRRIVLRAVEERDLDGVGALDDVQLVRTWPALSMTNPDPLPVDVSSPKKPASVASVVMLTTLLFTAA